MSTTKANGVLEAQYAAYARDYLRRLPLEHFMEAEPQAVRRQITLASLALLKGRRADVHLYNEMLVQYPRPRRRRPGQVVPDNMIVIYDGELVAEESYAVPLQPVGPFCVLEYVSRRSQRKDYKDSFSKYERELKVPYCLLFRPEKQELALYHHAGRRYVRVEPNRHGRRGIAELELELGLLGGWVRFWYQSKLLRLPAELQTELDKAERRAEQEKQRADKLQRQVEQERKARLALERELERLRGRRGVD